jgi:alpha-glucuronidase
MNIIDTGAAAWLTYLPMEIPQGETTQDIARSELRAGLSSLGFAAKVDVIEDDKGEGFEITQSQDGYVIKGGKTGVLYGVYHFLSAIAREESPLTPFTAPHYPLRMINHWDNMDGSVERGYAGRSLFFKNHQLDYDEQRIHRYARMLASVSINAICPNNVNVHPPMDLLITKTYLPQLKKLADILRLYGIRLLLTIEYSMPSYHGAGTADPHEKTVHTWWEERAAEVYRYIPDLVGFLVKADSEYRPGPFTYGRSHTQGANMLARALAPYGGKLFWRCFVYNCKQDWRDTETDRPKAAFATYAPLDGEFDDNVVLQIKNGPLDFQVREPASPLLYAMPNTNKALELQIAQEYTGHQIDLFYLAQLWRDVLTQLPKGAAQYIAAVGNLGDDDNWCGHDLAQANLYAYGRIAWLGESHPEQFAAEWARLTYPQAAEEVADILLASPAAYEKYAAPLGLGFMVNPHIHYGPSPEGYEFSLWGTYHRADQTAIGVDRSSRGTGFTGQYPDQFGALFDDPATCPEKLLLFFHRLRYDHVMADGRTLLQRIYDDHFNGAQEAEALKAAWEQLKDKMPERTFERVLARFERQVKNAREWRDVINTYFYRKSGIPDARGRMIYS